MPRLEYLSIIPREIFSSAALPRQPEPDLVMDNPEHVEAYAAAGRVENNTLAAYLFHTAHATETIAGARRVVDLGCGPAIQLLQIAAMNPSTEFLGLDLSQEMLAVAEREVARSGARNVTLRKADLTDLGFLGDGSLDAVISTMTLHHLPTHDHLTRCFMETRRVLKADGAVYFSDFSRLRTEHAIRFFSHMNEDALPSPVIEDAERSLRAAFAWKDYSERLPFLPPSTRLRSTFLVPLLVILHTRKRSLPACVYRRIAAMRRALPPRIRRDLDDLRLFFRLGRMDDDPFAGHIARTAGANTEPDGLFSAVRQNRRITEG